MIKLQDYTPKIYYNRSRDFQLLGRLFDVALNSSKSFSDMIYTIGNTDFIGTKLISLLASTLGFKQKHEYSIDQLASVCSILPSILREKGSEKAIILACQAILRAEGLGDNFMLIPPDPEDENYKPYQYVLLLPQLQNITLLLDLLDYIWPSGLQLVVSESGRLITSKLHTKAKLKQNAPLFQNQTDRNTMLEYDSQMGRYDEQGAPDELVQPDPAYYVDGKGEMTSGVLFSDSIKNIDRDSDN